MLIMKGRMEKDREEKITYIAQEEGLRALLNLIMGKMEKKTIKGIRQECPLNTVLFSININDSGLELRKEDGRSTVSNPVSNIKIHALLYADDVVIVPEGKE